MGKIEQRQRRRERRRRVSVEAAPVYGRSMFKAVLDTEDSKPERVRGATGRGYTHVSSLMTYCSRMQKLAEDHSMPVLRAPTGGHRVMWKIGRAVEAHIRDTYIKGVDYHNIYGTWVCKCGQMVRENTLFDHSWKSCRACRRKPKNYREAVLLDHDARVVGSPDLIVRTPHGMMPVEIKSMNANDWGNLQEPLADHLFQVFSYGRLMITNRMATVNRVALLYCTKDFRWGSPYKEFHVAAGDATTTLNSIERAWEAVRAGATVEGLPGRLRVCGDPGDPVPRQCPLLGPCFMRGSGEDA